MIDNGKETVINLNPKYKARAAYCVRVLLFNTTADCVRVLLINLTVDQGSPSHIKFHFLTESPP